MGPQRGTPKIGAPKSTGEIDHNAKPQTKSITTQHQAQEISTRNKNKKAHQEKQETSAANNKRTTIHRRIRPQANKTQQESTGEMDRNAKAQIK